MHSAKFPTVRFLKNCEVYILVVDPSENGPALHRLFEASDVDGKALNVKVFKGVCFERCYTFANA